MRKRALGMIVLGGVLAAPGAGATHIEPPGRGKVAPYVADMTAEDPLEMSAAAAAKMTARLVESVSSSAAARQSFIWPVDGAINTPFGGDHDGIDIEGETGDEIVAARDGRITFAGDDGDGYGTKIGIAHEGGMKTLYSHLSRTILESGWVKRGTVIGEVGCTGSCSGDHLHFEIQRAGVPVDPLPLLPGERS